MKLSDVCVADLVAVAIVAASRLTGADPERVARGELDDSLGYSISRARGYAALGLRQTTDWSSTAIGRMVNAVNPSNYIVLHKHKNWVVTENIEAVCEAIESFARGELRLPRPAAKSEPQPRPVSPRGVRAPIRETVGSISVEDSPVEDQAPDEIDVPPFLTGTPSSGPTGTYTIVPATPSPKNPRGPYIPPRPFVTPGKRDLLEELRKAVINTASIPIPPEDEQ